MTTIDKTLDEIRELLKNNFLEFEDITRYLNDIQMMLSIHLMARDTDKKKHEILTDLFNEFLSYEVLSLVIAKAITIRKSEENIITMDDGTQILPEDDTFRYIHQSLIEEDNSELYGDIKFKTSSYIFAEAESELDYNVDDLSEVGVLNTEMKFIKCFEYLSVEPRLVPVAAYYYAFLTLIPKVLELLNASNFKNEEMVELCRLIGEALFKKRYSEEEPENALLNKMINQIIFTMQKTIIRRGVRVPGVNYISGGVIFEHVIDAEIKNGDKPSIFVPQTIMRLPALLSAQQEKNSLEIMKTAVLQLIDSLE